MRRREFITLLGGAAATWPVVTRAQQQKLPVIGFLSGGPRKGYEQFVDAFREGLKEAGYVEGKNVAIEYRWADGQYELLSALAAELVRNKADVIFTTGSSASTIAAQSESSTTPIVFANASNPVQVGLVASLNRPSRNITGITILSVELLPKRLEILRELVPDALEIAVLVNPTNPTSETQIKSAQTAASGLGLRTQIVAVRSARDIEVAFEGLAERGIRAVLIGVDPVFTGSPVLLAALAQRHAIPVIFGQRAFVHAGGLVSYGANFADAYRQGAVYVGRILKGDKPSDLPVQQSTKIELFLNLKSAKTLGLTVPPSLLARADEVIE